MLVYDYNVWYKKILNGETKMTLSKLEWQMDHQIEGKIWWSSLTTDNLFVEIY